MRLPALTGALALVAVLITACSETVDGSPRLGAATPGASTTTRPGAGRKPFPTTGSPVPSITPSASASSGSSPLAGTDPCTLSQDAARGIGLRAGRSATLGYSRYCRYGGSGATLDVELYDTLKLDDLVSDGRQKHTSIHGRRAISTTSKPQLCIVSMAVGPTSRVDVVAGARGNLTTACRLVNRMADALEPALPG